MNNQLPQKTTKTQKFQEFFENHIYKMHLSKGYRVITLTWEQYLKAYTKETGEKISERQARTAKKELLLNDQIRQTFKVVEKYGKKFKYMQIILGKSSSLWGKLQSKAIRAKKALQYQLSEQSKEYYSKVKDLLRPAIDSYAVIMQRWFGYKEEKFEPCMNDFIQVDDYLINYKATL